MNFLHEICSGIVPQSREHRARAEKYIRTLTMPEWALGRLLDLAVDLAGMTRDLSLPVARKEVILMAGDHGIVHQKVSPQKSDVTLQMVHNFVRGGAGINALAGAAGARISVVDMGVAGDLAELAASGKIIDRKIAFGTKDFSLESAMTREEAVRSVETGIELVLERAGNTDVFATGEMGIGNTSPATAILTLLAGETDPGKFVGPGAGLPPEKLAFKAAVIRRGLEINRPDPKDPIDILAKVGGFEIGGMAGGILGAAHCRKPVLVDGFISTAGALLAARLAPAAAEYMILAHGSAEPGHVRMAELLGKKPLLDLNLRLGEGTGAALAMPLLDAASAVMNKMATFDSAGVTVEGIR